MKFNEMLETLNMEQKKALLNALCSVENAELNEMNGGTVHELSNLLNQLRNSIKKGGIKK